MTTHAQLQTMSSEVNGIHYPPLSKGSKYRQIGNTNGPTAKQLSQSKQQPDGSPVLAP
jgi:hypothetical protein